MIRGLFNVAAAFTLFAALAMTSTHGATNSTSATAPLVSARDATPITITTTTTLPNGVLTVPYSQQFAATGGTGTLTYTSGALPPGLALSSTGILSGTPTTIALNSTITVTVTDSIGTTAAGVFNISIIGSQPIINSVTISPLSAVVGQTVIVNALGVTSDDGQPAIVTIDFGDGSASVVGSPATHIYTVPGTYTINVTAASTSSGLFSTFTQPITVGLSITGTTVLIGKSGQPAKSGFSARYMINYGTPSNSTATSHLVHLVLPATLTQNDLTSQPGMITVGSGPLAVIYPFALTKNGNAKTVALTNIAIGVKAKTAQFTTQPDARLEAYAQSIGVLSNLKSIIVQIPVTIEIPGKVFIFVELECQFKCPAGRTSTGTLTH